MNSSDSSETRRRRMRVGIVGFGSLGRYLYEQLSSGPELGLEVAFVSNRSPERLREVAPELVLPDLEEFASRAPDLVVEVAHPDISVRHGRAFLECAHYMPLSLTALADAKLERDLFETAQQHGTTLFIPHGAVVGLESIAESKDSWDEITVTMTKNPAHLDFAAAPQSMPPPDVDKVLLYEGPTRGICPLFPRNVNSHAAVALAGLGFDRTRSILICDRAADVSTIEVMARGRDLSLRIERSNPLKGVSGVFTLHSALGAVCRAVGPARPVQIC